MKKKALYIIILVLVLLVGGAGVFALNVWKNDIDLDQIYEGIYIENIDVSNKTKQEALSLLEENFNEDLKRPVKLYTADNSYTFIYDDIGYKYNYEEAINKAYDIGKDGNIINRYLEIKNLKNENININLEYEYSKEMIEEVANEVSKNLNKESKDAVFNFNGGNFLITEEEEGYQVDKEALANLIEDSINERFELEIPLNVLKPKFTKEDYKRINGVIGQYTTKFENSSIGRKKNIQISGNSLNGIVVNPGETLSYNMVTGPRQRKYGYEEAPVILNGKYIPGVGGGVCQTSTTLYNAILLADLTVTQRQHHSIPPPYVSKGTDAVVTDGPLDLVFRNDFDFPIYISTYVTDKSITISIYGDTNTKDYTVSIKPEIVETIPYETKEILDSNLEKGKIEVDSQGRNGYKVKTYKSKIKNGKVIENTLISQDFYKPNNHVYRKGTKEVDGNTKTVENIKEGE